MKPKQIDSPDDSMFKAVRWGPFTWGHDEFNSWFGVNLPWLRWPSSWAARFGVFDRTIIQDGFYGLHHSHN